jgi:hypothetical protein
MALRSYAENDAQRPLLEGCDADFAARYSQLSAGAEVFLSRPALSRCLAQSSGRKGWVRE